MKDLDNNIVLHTIARKRSKQSGFSFIELVIVLLIGVILATLAIPQMLSSRRLMRFTGMQREIASKLRETRQEAMSQRQPITFRYDHNNKRIIIYGGAFGAPGVGANRITELAQGGLTPDEIGYGRPTGIPPNALSDGTNLTPLDSTNIVEVTFQADGAVTDASGNLQNKALFFYNRITPAPTAFALSILGAGGRVKVWRYNAGASAYIE